jgi:hypothetical protein
MRPGPKRRPAHDRNTTVFVLLRVLSLRCGALLPRREEIIVARYRVTVRVSSIEIVDADNPYQAAVIASNRHGADVEIADVRPAKGRAPSTTSKPTTSKTVKKAVNKRRRMSPETRAKMVQNLVKARAARARNLKAVAKKSAKKTTAKKVGGPAKKKATKRA